MKTNVKRYVLLNVLLLLFSLGRSSMGLLLSGEVCTF